jgi:23S rRNA (cytosine1962-C5)-methyltransferase
MFELDLAWNWREKQGWMDRTEALRIFHGPGEGIQASESFAVDRFKDHYWVTLWESSKRLLTLQKNSVEFLRSKGATSVVAMIRPQAGLPAEPIIWYGAPPQDRFVVNEGSLRFWIQLQKCRHPGLFLDHYPLRTWLLKNTRGLRVLNTFAYTGSLSVAAAVGGAEKVTSLDLSKPSLEWATANIQLNGIHSENHRAISGDVFEWLPRLRREKQHYDCIILDPPSFSRGKKKNFSTARDLTSLHQLAMELLAPQGVLITSINSENVNLKKYESDVLAAAETVGTQFQVLRQIDLPETFPTRLGHGQSRYLKGWILRAQSKRSSSS